jgi:hypothetical protein
MIFESTSDFAENKKHPVGKLARPYLNKKYLHGGTLLSFQLHWRHK